MYYNTIKKQFNKFLNQNLNIPKISIKFRGFKLTNSFESESMIGYSFKSNCVNHSCCKKKMLTKDFREKTIFHSVFNNKPVIVRFKYKRFKCSKCNRIINHKLPFDISGQKSSELANNIVNEFREKVTYSQTARRYNISTNNVINVIDKYDQLKPIEYTTYTAIGIDENRLLSGRDSKYQTVIIDNKTKEVIEILETRFKSDLNEYFSKNKFLNLETVTQDLWRVFEQVVTTNTKAQIVADRFHVVRQGMWAFNRVRIELQKNTGVKTNKNWKLLNKRYSKLKPEGKSKLLEILRKDRELLKAYLLKEKYLKLMSCKELGKYYKLEERFLKIIKRYRVKHFEPVVKCIGNWRTAILNMIANPGLSNGLTERINRDLKQIRNISFGLKNLERLNKRAKLYINAN